ncbi:MAG: hypothetical protein KJ070_04425 [Verrucomicrobia bacterium]|nr:hypothetical protein [Verrucomicrobiota bacterium]
MNRSNFVSRACGALGLSLIVLAVGCGREEPKVYRIPKESAALPPAQGLPHGHPEINTAKPKLSWTLPEGWVEGGAGQMSLANFNISGDGGKQAQVSVTPLQGLAGKEVPIVNMWRHQVGLPELAAEEVQRQLQEVEIAGEPGKMFEVASPPDASNPPLRIVTAMVHRGDTSWFYKLQGDADLVAAQKTAFVAFLKSVKLDASGATETATETAATPPPTEAAPVAEASSKTPPGWKSVPPGPMQSSKFLIPEQGSAKGEVTISVFPNSTGGTLANVNRWRGQIGLSPIGEAELAKMITRLDPRNSEVILVDMTNPDTRRQLIGAILPKGGQWYFYKLMGDAEAVAPQKEAFTAFVKAKL